MFTGNSTLEQNLKMANEDILDDLTEVKTSENLKFDFPLEFEFKIGTLANDFVARDSQQKLIAYVRQKMFKFKEDIQVFADEGKQHELFRIKADRVIDFNANYLFANNVGDSFGRVGRRGAKSLLKATYLVFDQEGKEEFTIQEENPWAKVGDAIFNEIPIVGMLTGYVFNPKYIVKRPDGTEVIRLKKEPSFWGRRFKLEKLSELQDDGEDTRLLLSLMMMSLLERRRG